MARMEGLALSVSATTRDPRPGEREGVDYHFLSETEFLERVERGEFLEHARYAGNLYGTPRSELERDCLALVLEIEVQGARQVREALPDAVRVFIEPPSLEALKVRLQGRGSEAADAIERRLALAREEMEAREEFQNRVVNDDLERAVEEMMDLVATMSV